MSHLVRGSLALALSVVLSLPAAAARYECSWFFEPIAFRLWSSQAGKPVSSDFEGMDEVSIAPITTEVNGPTGRETLVGYRMTPAKPEDQLRARLLVIQGNGHRASALLKPLSGVAKSGVEILVYDFRGYGNSQLGGRSASQIISDYRQLIETASKSSRTPYFIYGISFGGVVALNAIQSEPKIARLILDSVPATLSELGCPSSWNPIERVKVARRPTTYIVAGRDTVVLRSAQQELINTYLSSNGSKVVEAPNSFHPFTPGVIERERITLILDALRDD